MLPRGRPPGPGSAEEKAAIRREKVRLNVKAYRERKKNALATDKAKASLKRQPSTTSSHERASPARSSISSVGGGSSAHSDQDDVSDTAEEQTQLAVRPRDEPLQKLQQVWSRMQPQGVTTGTTWAEPDAAPVFSAAFISFFRNSFLPHKVNLPSKGEGHSLLVTPCSAWITTAYNMALGQNDGALRNGVLAMGLVLNGLVNSSSELKVASLQRHRQAIAQLRNELSSLSLQRQSKRTTTSSIAPYLSCLSVVMFEMVQSGFSAGIIQHLKALNSLIEMMYSDPNVDTFLADLIMEDFGMLEMLFCLKYGFASFLRTTRKRIALAHQARSGYLGTKKNASVYGDILDIVEELPALIVQTKTLQQAQAFSNKLCDDLQKVIRKVFKIQAELDAWYIQFEVRHGSIMIQESFLDQSTGELGSRPRLRSYEHGATGLFMFGFQLSALDANIEATTTLAYWKQCQHVQFNLPSPKSTSRKGGEPQFGDNLISSFETSNTNAPKVVPSYNHNGFLHDQVKTQRAKMRVVMRQVLELMRQYSASTFNISGRSLLFGPCDRLKEMLPKEESRLQEDLWHVPTGDDKAAAEINRSVQDLDEISTIFNILQDEMKRFDSGGIPDA